MNNIPVTNPTCIPGADTVDNPDYLTTVRNEVGKHYDDPVDTSLLRAVSTTLPVPLANSVDQYGLRGSNAWTGYQTDSYSLEQESRFPDGNLSGLVDDILSDLNDDSDPDSDPGGNPPQPQLVVTYDPFMDYDDDDDGGPPGIGGNAQAESLKIKHEHHA